MGTYNPASLVALPTELIVQISEYVLDYEYAKKPTYTSNKWCGNCKEKRYGKMKLGTKSFLSMRATCRTLAGKTTIPFVDCYREKLESAELLFNTEHFKAMYSFAANKDIACYMKHISIKMELPWLKQRKNRKNYMVDKWECYDPADHEEGDFDFLRRVKSGFVTEKIMKRCRFDTQLTKRRTLEIVLGLNTSMYQDLVQAFKNLLSIAPNLTTITIGHCQQRILQAIVASGHQDPLVIMEYPFSALKGDTAQDFALLSSPGARSVIRGVTVGPQTFYQPDEISKPEELNPAALFDSVIYLHELLLECMKRT